MGRDYRNEYDKYQGSEQQKKNRAKRNAARREMIRRGAAKKGDGKDVGHKKALSKGGGNTLMNLFMQGKTENRSFSRKRDGSMKSERSKGGK
jgi:hypothetical protein